MQNIIPCTGSTFTKTATKCVASFKSNNRHPPCNVKPTTRGPEDGLVGDSVALGDRGQVGERGSGDMIIGQCSADTSPSLYIMVNA